MHSPLFQRITRRYSHVVAAPPQTVFPLLCPVRESDWIPYWRYRLVYSDSGTAENNCIFTTDFPEMGAAIWVVSRYDEKQFSVEFVVTCPQTHVEKITIHLEPLADGTTKVNWERIYTALTESGNETIRKLSGALFAEKMALIAKALDHFCRTGTIIRVE
jgi:hypothetical protein